MGCVREFGGKLEKFGDVPEDFSASYSAWTRGSSRVRDCKVSRQWTAQADAESLSAFQTSYNGVTSYTDVKKNHSQHTSSCDEFIDARVDSRSRARAGRFRDITGHQVTSPRAEGRFRVLLVTSPVRRSQGVWRLLRQASRHKSQQRKLCEQVSRHQFGKQHGRAQALFQSTVGDVGSDSEILNSETVTFR